MGESNGYHLILGSGSAIASAIANRLAADGKPLILAGRRLDAIADQATDLRIRYAVAVEILEFDAFQPAQFPAFVQRCWEVGYNRVDAVIVCYGVLTTEFPPDKLSEEIAGAMQVNLVSVIQILEAIAIRFAAANRGTIVAISSVAGDRGRQSNYVYGAAKAGLNAYLSGLRNRLFPRGVHVLTVKPGFTESPMTAGKVSPDSPLLASPDRVARDIIRAMKRRANIIYTPWWWRGIMTIITSIPESIFKRLKL